MTKVVNPPLDKRVYFPSQLACREIEKSGARLMECLMPPKSDLNDFMIVGKAAWQEREDILVDCQLELTSKEKPE